MPTLHLETPQWLHVLWAVPLLIGIVWHRTSVQSWRWRVLISVVRCIILAAVAVALASPVLLQQEVQTLPSTVVLIHDVSDSVGRNNADAAQRHARYARAVPDTVRIRSIYFASTPVPRNPPPEFDTSGTDIETALDLSGDRAAGGGEIHLVLFSDGVSTVGDPVAAATRVAAVQGHVHVVPVGKHSSVSPQIVSLVPPEGARVGLPTYVRVRVRTDEPLSARVALVDQDGVEVVHTKLLAASDREVALPIRPKRRGLHRWRAVLTPSASRMLPDEVEFRFNVQGPPQVLVLDPYPSDAEPLKRVLEGIGFTCQIGAVSDFPDRAESLARYDAVFLSDWPAPKLGREQLQRLREYISNGGAAVFVGGAQVNAKRWHDSPLEQLLPISFAPEPARVIQKYDPVHVCFVLDISGSMAEALGVDSAGNPVTKFALTRRAVIESLRQLPESAIVSIVAFDTSPHVLVEGVPVKQRQRIESAVRGLLIGSGTNMVPGLRNATNLLNRTEIARHMIVLTDGVSMTNPDDDLCDWIRNSDIHVTAVAVGGDSNTAILKYFANRTHGQYVYCDSAAFIPRIFVKAARTIRTIAKLKRKPFRPHPGPQADILGRLASSRWPVLEAAMSAEPKPSPLVQVALLNERGQPLLAIWPVGLGQVAALTTDAKPIWSRHWFQWRQYSQFWTQLMAGLLRPQPQYRSRVESELRGNRFEVLVSIKDADGRLVPNLAPQGILRAIAGAERGESVTLEWQRLPSGLFTSSTRLHAATRYVCALDFRKSDGSPVLDRQMIVGGQRSTELLRTGPDEERLRAIAAAGNGQYDLTPRQLAGLMETPDARPHLVRRKLWYWFVAAALLLWPIDIALRKFAT